MSNRTDVRAFTVAALCTFTALQAMALRCPEKTTTNVVYVEFQGCAKAQPGLQFDVQVGDETITVSKNAAVDPYWIGRTRELFVITEPKLTLLADAAPIARATCGSHAIPEKKGQCVALFSVKCEPLWRLKVERDTKKKATITSKLNKSSKPIHTCPADTRSEEEIEGPLELDLARSEQLVVKIGKVTAKPEPPMVETSLTYSSFGSKTEMTLSDPNVSLKAVPRPGQAPTPALEATLKAAARAAFPDLRFIRNCLAGPCER